MYFDLLLGFRPFIQIKLCTILSSVLYTDVTVQIKTRKLSCHGHVLFFIISSEGQRFVLNLAKPRTPWLRKVSDTKVSPSELRTVLGYPWNKKRSGFF